VDVTGGYAWQNFRSDFELDYFDQSAEVDPILDLPYVENRLISFFGRATYDYAGKYLVTASIRRDGSTRFGPDNQWGIFPAIGIGWRILEENFASPLTNIFTELKLRASYGLTGNEQIGDYNYSTFYRGSLNGANYQFGNEYVPTLTPNGSDKTLQWEENEAINLGLDASVLDGKVTFGLDFYQRTVRELLFVISPPAGSVPDDQLLTNIGSVQNKGVELVTSVVAYDREDFTWNIGFNASYNKNEIIKLDNKTGENLDNFPGYRSGGISGDIGQSIQIRKVGQPIDAFFVYKHKENSDGSLVLDPDGDGIQSLFEMYEDLNGDGIINENDLRPYKQPQPKVLLGFTSNMTYKSWDMAFTLRASFGNYVYNNLASSSGYYQRLTDVVTNNVHASVLDTNFKTRQLFSDYYVQNASFLKLDNITLGYNFNKFSFGKVRAYVTAQNLLTLSPYEGIEPELFNGIENSPYPRSMTLTVGVNATFK
jgi:TonB-dependent starch-binding outer membrane protein SusC